MAFDQVIGALGPDPGDRLQVAADAVDAGRVERLGLARVQLHPVAGVVLEDSAQAGARLLLEVTERADRRHRQAVGKRHLDHGEGAVLAREAHVLDGHLPVEEVTDGGAGVEKSVLSDRRAH